MLFKATDDHWYLIIGNFEEAEEIDDCSVCGPFPDEEAADDYRIKNFSNPGGTEIDDSGTQAPPENAESPRDQHIRQRRILW